jgi:hypothetical protein
MLTGFLHLGSFGSKAKDFALFLSTDYSGSKGLFVPNQKLS